MRAAPQPVRPNIYMAQPNSLQTQTTALSFLLAASGLLSLTV